jgi:quercetin dioxygenase-like cupin family protein
MHRHPYEEIFIVLQGESTLDVGSVSGGGPAVDSNHLPPR